MIKVLMCGNHPSNKGGMTSVINQIREHDWKSEGIELEFIPTYMPGNPVKKAFYFIVAYVRIVVRMMINKPDVVHMHMSYKGSFTRKHLIHKLCMKNHVPDIIHLHGIKLDEWYQSLLEEKKKKVRDLFSECERVIVLGKSSEKIVYSIAANADTVVVGNSVRIPNSTVSWDKNKIETLYLGILIPAKGVADLLKAIKRLDEKQEIGRLHFTIAGTGPEEETLRIQAKNLGIYDYIDFIGWVSGEQKEAVLKQSQFMVLPSYSEGLPVSILEAMSYGLPVISTNVGDIGDAVVDNENGYLIEPGDINALADSILKMKNRQEWEHLSVASRRKAELEFDITQFYKQLASAWKGVKEYGTEKTKVDRPTSEGET